MHGFYGPNGLFRVVVLDECRPLIRWLVEDPELYDIAMLIDQTLDLGKACLVDVSNAYLSSGNSLFFQRRLGRKRPFGP